MFMKTNEMTTEISLTAREAAALTAYITQLHRQLDGNLLTVILYGSKARGDATPDSDIDLLTVLRHTDEPLKQTATDIAWEIALEYDVPLSPIVVNAQRYQELRAERFTFYRNVHRDGYTLYPPVETAPRHDASIIATKTPPLILEDVSVYMSTSEVGFYLNLAQEALQAAQDNVDRHYSTTVNRAYYAIFYAASATLASKGIGRSKHSGVQSAFGYEFIRTGVIEPEYGKMYTTALTNRLDSDYDIHTTTDETTARRVLADAQKFVARIEDYLRATKII